MNRELRLILERCERLEAVDPSAFVPAPHVLGDVLRRLDEEKATALDALRRVVRGAP